MIALGLGVVWGGYTLGLWGFCLVRGYDVTFVQCATKLVWPGGGAAKAAEGGGESALQQVNKGSTGTPATGAT